MSTDLYFSQNIIRVINSRNGMGGACSKCGERREAYRVLVGKPQGTDDLKDPGADGRII